MDSETSRNSCLVLYFREVATISTCAHFFCPIIRWQLYACAEFAREKNRFRCTHVQAMHPVNLTSFTLLPSPRRCRELIRLIMLLSFSPHRNSKILPIDIKLYLGTGRRDMVKNCIRNECVTLHFVFRVATSCACAVQRRLEFNLFEDCEMKLEIEFRSS